MRLAIVLLVCCPVLLGQAVHPGTEVVMLGSGTPNADPERSGPAVAIIVNGHAYLVDCGAGVVRRAAAATRAGVPGLAMRDLNTVFITHLHSDHTLGYPDLILTPWVLGRSQHLSAYGPHGLGEMTRDILAAWSKDIAVRTKGLEHANSSGYLVDVHEIQPGVIYKDENVTVKAFLVKHGSWDEAFGFRFETAERNIVLSGDTSPTEAVVTACNGCDLLLHEVYAQSAHAQADSASKAYFNAFHTSTEQVAAIASRAKPKLLVLYHQVFHGVPEGELVQQVREHYTGAVVSAHDLDVY